jgi:hypothetical protein
MEEKEIILIIEINYNNTVKEIRSNEIITYEELKQKSIELFNITEDKKNNIEFTYIDEDGDFNILGNKNEEIVNAAKELDGNYILNLNLSIIDLIKVNDDIAIIDEKEKNEIIMKEKEDENDDKKDEILKREDIEKIQNNFKNELRIYYKCKIEEMKKRINDLINEMHNLIEKKIDCFILNSNNKDFIINNIYDIDDNTKLTKMEIDGSMFTLLDKNDYYIIYKNKEKKINTPKNNKKKVNNDTLVKIKEKIKKLLLEKNQTNSVIMKYGEDIYNKMNNEKVRLDINDINEYFKIYLQPKEKENNRNKFIEILDKIYKYIEIKNINQMNLEFFEKEKFDEKITEKIDESDEDLVIVNFEDKKDYISSLDSIADTTNYKLKILENLYKRI